MGKAKLYLVEFHNDKGEKLGKYRYATYEDNPLNHHFYDNMREYAEYIIGNYGSRAEVQDLGATETHVHPSMLNPYARDGRWPDFIPNYGGIMPRGDFLMVTRHRDSSFVENWVFEQYEKALKAFWPYVYVNRASHWAVGWMEHLMVSQFAPPDVLEKIIETIEDFPRDTIPNEDEFYEAVHERIVEVWEEMTADEKLEYLRKSADEGEIDPIPPELEQEVEEDWHTDAVDKWLEEQGKKHYFTFLPSEAYHRIEEDYIWH